MPHASSSQQPPSEQSPSEQPPSEQPPSEQSAGDAVEEVCADEAFMREALAAARRVRTITSPNPWVGCLIVPQGEGPAFEGATAPAGGPHAEAVALSLAGEAARGATVYVTLEPCSHRGRTPPCADALIDAGVSRVVIGVIDPDPRVAGGGIRRLRDAGIEVVVGVAATLVEDNLRAYLKQRSTGLPWVVLKLATTLDGRIAAPDGTSKWITGPAARADAHRLRAESDAILVGAATVRADDPALTVRHVAGVDPPEEATQDWPKSYREPLRVVLGSVRAGARVLPALEHHGELVPLLHHLAGRGVIQLLVEGGARVAYEFHRSGLVDQYVLYLAPAFLGGDDGVPVFSGAGTPTMSELWRGRLWRVARLGDDLRLDVLAKERGNA